LIWIKKNSRLYVADFDGVKTLDLKLKILSSWNYSRRPEGCYYALKFDNDIFYIGFYYLHKVCLYSLDGKVLDQWGIEGGSNQKGYFRHPLGVTVNNKYAYICDCYNSRIQILTKEKGIFYNQWDDIGYPYSIFYDLNDNIVYIGSLENIQLRNKDDGVCVQQIAGSTVFGIYVMKDFLFVSNNFRFEIFRRKE